MAADAPAAFFSYSRDDLEFALRLAKDLKKAGANVWMDKLDIRPGQPWQRKIDEALSSCSRVLVILSPSSVDSDNVMGEVTVALDEKREVIPVLYRDCRVPPRLRLLQHVDFRSDYLQALGELLTSVAVEQTQEAAPAPPPTLGERQPAVSDADELERAVDQARLERERKQAAERARFTRLEQKRKKAARPARPKQDRPVAKGAVRQESGIVLKLRELRTLVGHTDSVMGVALSGDGRSAVSASG